MPKFAANLTMLFNEMPLLDRFAAAKAAGFAGVEYLFPYDFDKAQLREQLEAHGLTQVLHNLPAGNWAGGERGIAILPGRSAEFRDGVFRAIDYAGPERAFNTMKPVSDKLGKNVTRVGANGDGQTTKVANQIIVALTIEAVSGALLFASKAGANPALVRQALMGGFASSLTFSKFTASGW